MPGEFDQLLVDVEGMAKEAPAGSPENPAGGAPAAGGEGGGAGNGGTQVVLKALSVKNADGTEVEAFDATEILKALNMRSEIHGTMIDQVRAAFPSVVEILKADRVAIAEMHKVMIGQSAMIKSLSAEVETLKNQGSGRRTMLALEDLGQLAKAGLLPGGQGGGGGGGTGKATPAQVMAKAAAWAKDGKIHPFIPARIEAYQLNGDIAPPDVITAYPDLFVA